MQNNPAVRLYDLTRRLRSTSVSASPARRWAQALSIPIDHEAPGLPLVPIVEGIFAFLHLVNETEAGIHELGFDDFCSEVIPPLRQVVQTSLANLRANRSNLTRPITKETLTLLRVIAADWAKKKPDPEIDEEILKEIQAEAHNLFESISRAAVDKDLKRLILSLTSEIEQAIQHYRIGGPERLKRALALIIGQAYLDNEIADKARRDEGARIWWTRFLKVAEKFAAVVRLANDTRKTIEAISPFIHLAGGSPEIPPADLDSSGK